MTEMASRLGWTKTTEHRHEDPRVRHLHRYVYGEQDSEENLRLSRRLFGIAHPTY